MSDYELLHGSAESIADLLGCSVRTARRYKSGSTELPEPCRRLLRLRRNGDLAALLGSDWEGFCFDRHGLLQVVVLSACDDPALKTSAWVYDAPASSVSADR